MWEKIGFYNVPKTPDWMHSHCQLPVALPIDEHTVRVFFAARSAQQRSHIGYVELVINGQGIDVIKVSEAPVLAPGPMGHFDQHGVFPSSIVFHNGLYYMYYIGWSQGVEAPLFDAAIGLATSEDGVHFTRTSPAPLLGRSAYDPCLVTSPHVYKDGDLFRMTYVSGIKWERGDDGILKSFYHIKQASGTSPYDCNRRGDVAIDFKDGETNIARSSVIKVSDDHYKMWYAYVHGTIGKYRIGYAESPDGSTWTRMDDRAGIGLDDTHASEMISYPHVFEMGDDLYMLYNGNQFGRDGFGVAKWQNDDQP